MKQDEIIEMAEQAGFYIIPNSPDLFPKLVAFAKLVAAKEREACAKVCDKYNFGQAPAMIQNAIRARGQA